MGNQTHIKLIEETPERWRIERHGEMRVPGIVFASRALLPSLVDDRSLDQVANVATLPGIVEASYAMPDVHWGYGFPIGGVAATDVERGGVVSPGGVGFDISCGVRLLTTPMTSEELLPRRTALLDALDRLIPRGLGPGAVWRLQTDAELDAVLQGGARYAVERGHGVPADLDHCEDRGAVADASLEQLSSRARERGAGQVGSLGAGNHFLEVQVVDSVLDDTIANAWGLFAGQMCVLIHSGSRGLGHQICTDHVRRMQPRMRAYDIHVPDAQLACVPVQSPDGAAYLGAMAAAANYGRANRQLLTAATRRAFAEAVGTEELTVLYDVSHNLARLEWHEVAGERRRLCVHRKGATRALPPGHPELPADLAATGQPVLVPGSMGTASWVLVGAAGGAAFHSTCHGAGRRMSRHAARRQVRGEALRQALESAGVGVRSHSMRALAEEAPDAYKDVDEVVATCVRAGLAGPVARLRPVGVIKA
jgi:tRNA-splicing ligase RtcB